MHKKILTNLYPLVLGIILIPASLIPAIISKTNKLKKVECKAPLAGTWEGIYYKTNLSKWYLLTLTIRRPNPQTKQLRGKITFQSWFGTANDKRRYSCGQERFLMFVTTKARGSINGDLFKFKGYGPTRGSCKTPYNTDQYNRDSFHGKVDFKKHIIEARNNDGGMSINQPITFIRISCFD